MPNFDLLLTPLYSKGVECLLRDGHKDDHLGQLDTGEYILWSPDSECGCGESHCECFAWMKISEEEAAALLSA